MTNYYWIVVVFGVFGLDRITKLLTLQYLLYKDPINILPILNLRFAYNSGAAFGFLNQATGWQGWLFIAIAVIVSSCLVIWLFTMKAQNIRLKVALSLILGGTLGNLYDRIVYHYVIDFLDFYYKTWHFPTFNLADTAICIGALIFIIDVICEEHTTNPNKTNILQ